MYIPKENRPKILKEMDDYIRKEISDESFIIDIWLTMGVPDGADDCDYNDAVENDDFWTDCLEAFMRTILFDK